jgi:hypothetical protein
MRLNGIMHYAKISKAVEEVEIQSMSLNNSKLQPILTLFQEISSDNTKNIHTPSSMGKNILFLFAII